jgi:DNA-binding LacI/PurR family transcriptional regulator
MAINIEDIAKAAGVSTATVSRVLNNPSIVSAATRQRVEEAIELHGYKPSIFARGLMSSRTGSVGILTSYISNPYMTSIIESIESVLAKDDTFIYLCNCGPDLELEREYAQELLRRKVDALIVLETPSLNEDGGYFLGLEADCPVILVNEHLSADAPHHIVRCAQEPGLQEALRHFLSRDLLPIGLMTGEDDSYSFALKRRLFAEFRESNGLTERSAPFYSIGADSNYEDIVYRAAKLTAELFRKSDPPRAILAGNDMIGVGVLQGALGAGIKVPGDLAIIGVDNTLLSRICVPQLSSVNLRMEDVGRIAAELYLRIRSGYVSGKAKTRETIASSLVLRATT